VRQTLASASQIYVLDHGSSDGTSAILAALREEVEIPPMVVLPPDGPDAG
jgi:hypothetical protein